MAFVEEMFGPNRIEDMGMEMERKVVACKTEDANDTDSEIRGLLEFFSY